MDNRRKQNYAKVRRNYAKVRRNYAFCFSIFFNELLLEDLASFG